MTRRLYLIVAWVLIVAALIGIGALWFNPPKREPAWTGCRELERVDSV